MNEEIAVIIFCSVVIAAWLGFLIYFIVQRVREKKETRASKKKQNKGDEI